MIDAASGERLGAIIEGQHDTIDIQSHYAAMRPERRYVQLHTHPRSSAPGRADAAIVIRRAAIASVVVAGGDGSWYVLSKVPGAEPADVDTMRRRWVEVHDTLDRLYGPLVEAGVVDVEAAWRAETHEIWQRIAADLRLRYDRLEPGER
jgi:hypothetical protein